MTPLSGLRTKNVYRVPNVQVGSDAVTVSFKVVGKNKQRPTVRCATRGRKPFRVEPDDGNLYLAVQRGVDQIVTGKTARLAFAKAVQIFWG